MKKIDNHRELVAHQPDCNRSDGDEHRSYVGVIRDRNETIVFSGPRRG